MIVAYTKADVIEYMGVITEHVDMDHPVLLDKYIMGTECEVDAICDGENFLIPGIMEQVERTGVHSGDSICVYPAQHLTQPRSTPLWITPAALPASSTSPVWSMSSTLFPTARSMSSRSTPVPPYRALHLQGHRRAHGGSGCALLPG